VPQAEENVGVVGDIHVVGTVGADPGSCSRRWRRSWWCNDVAAEVAENDRDACVPGQLAPVLDAVGVGVAPDGAGDRVRRSGLVAEVGGQIDRADRAQIAGRLAGDAAIGIDAIGQTHARVGQRAGIDLHHVGGGRREPAEVIVPSRRLGGRHQGGAVG